MFTLTNFGITWFADHPGEKPVLNQFRIGSGYGYTPTVNQTSLEGITQFTGTPSIPRLLEDGEISYTLFMDLSVGDFEWGEIGIYLNGSLFGVSSHSSPSLKSKITGSHPGNAVSISMIIHPNQTVGIVLLNNTDNEMNISRSGSIDLLPPAHLANPNVTMVANPINPDRALVALAEANIWNISGYEHQIFDGELVGATANTLRILSDLDEAEGEGDFLVHFTSGPASGYARIVKSWDPVGKVLLLSTALQNNPLVGDRIIISRWTQSTRDESVAQGATHSLLAQQSAVAAAASQVIAEEKATEAAASATSAAADALSTSADAVTTAGHVSSTAANAVLAQAGADDASTDAAAAAASALAAASSATTAGASEASVAADAASALSHRTAAEAASTSSTAASVAAASSQTASSASQTASAASAVAAAGSATSANLSAVSAASNAATATTKATDASTQASIATNAASTATDASADATTAATAAALSLTNSLAAAALATDSASTSAVNEANSTYRANIATTKAAEAAASATLAGSRATAAIAAATASEASATASDSSADASAASASLAQDASTTSNTQAGIAATHATTATTQASLATEKRNEAAGFASDSSTSAAASQVSATASEASRAASVVLWTSTTALRDETVLARGVATTSAAAALSSANMSTAQAALSTTKASESAASASASAVSSVASETAAAAALNHSQEAGTIRVQMLADADTKIEAAEIAAGDSLTHSQTAGVYRLEASGFADQAASAAASVVGFRDEMEEARDETLVYRDQVAADASTVADTRVELNSAAFLVNAQTTIATTKASEASASAAQVLAAQSTTYTNAVARASVAAGVSGGTAVSVGAAFTVIAADGLTTQRYIHSSSGIATADGAPFPTSAYVEAVDQTAGATAKAVTIGSKVNLYDPSLAVYGAIYVNATGLQQAYADCSVSGKIPVQEGKRYIIKQVAGERGMPGQGYCWNSSGVFLGLMSGIAGTDRQLLDPGTSGGFLTIGFTVPVGSGITHVGFWLVYTYVAHTLTDFDRIRSNTMMTLATSFPYAHIPYEKFAPASIPKLAQIDSAFSLTPQRNIYDPARAVNGVIRNYGPGNFEAFANGIYLGEQAVEAGKTYTMSLNDGAISFNSNQPLYCFDAIGKYLGIATAIGATPAMASPPTGIVWTGGNQVSFTIPPGSLIRYVSTSLNYLVHTNAQFTQYVNSVQMEEGAVKTAFQAYSPGGSPVIKAEALPPLTLITTSTASIKVTKSGNDVYILTAFDATHDLVQRLILTTAASNGSDTVNFSGARKVLRSALANASSQYSSAGTQLAYQGDDAAPLHYNGFYMGANHGAFIVREVTATGHGKAIQDVGSEWTDSASRKWYLMRIVGVNTLWFVSENLSVYPAWSFASSITGSTLTHSSGATNTGAITVASSVQTQLWPSLQGQTYSVLLDGKTAITADGDYSCESLDVVNSYNIPNPAAVVAYVRGLVGGATQPAFNHTSIAADVSRSLTYRFAENGSVAIVDGVQALNNLTLKYFGTTQAAVLTYSGKQLWQYMPRVTSKTNPSGTWNLAAQAQIDGIFESLTLDAANFTDVDNPPDRMAQIVKTAGVSEFGMMVGYSPVRSVGLPATRKTLVNTAGFISAARKQYPYAVNTGPMVAGSYYEVAAYRAFWSATQAPQATTFVWYRDGKSVIVVADFHQSVSLSALKLPSKFTGMGVSVIDKTASMTLHGSGVLSDRGLMVSVSGGYGYGVFKLD